MICRQVIDWSATAASVQALGSLGAVWTAVFIARGQAAREKKRIADAVEEARRRRITLAESVARLVTTRLALAESQLQSTTPAAARVAAEGMRSDLGMIDRFPIWELESVPAVTVIAQLRRLLETSASTLDDVAKAFASPGPERSAADVGVKVKASVKDWRTTAEDLAEKLRVAISASEPPV